MQELPEPPQPSLTRSERKFLAAGMLEWSGPGRASDELARAMGFENEINLREQGLLLHDALRARDSLTPLDWTRALISTEVCFASDYFGAGVEWPIVTGFSDEESIRLLRSLQRKLIHYRPRDEWIGTFPEPPGI
jgi:hypothetical protein